MMRRVAAAAAISLLVCGQALAAGPTVSGLSGNVSVNQGGGYRPLTAGATLNTGDLVMAQRGGTVRLVYSDGCVVSVTPGNVVVVSPTPPCAPPPSGPNAGGGSPFAFGSGAGLFAAAGVVTGAVALKEVNKDKKPKTP